jgi:hypothetical protein
MSLSCGEVSECHLIGVIWWGHGRRDGQPHRPTHDGRAPAATAWVLCAGTAVVLGTTIVLTASMQTWDRDRGVDRPFACICADAAVTRLIVGAARSAL